ncbi:MAG TPA: hypothetical protein VEV17_11605 [Bryobacteraceae bacterium]|nr:hypothetical protein [Bryobacteraceae bacterium]
METQVFMPHGFPAFAFTVILRDAVQENNTVEIVSHRANGRKGCLRLGVGLLSKIKTVH